MADKKPVVKKAAPKTTAKAKPVKKTEKKVIPAKPVKKTVAKAVPAKKTVKAVAPKKAVAVKAPSKAIKIKQVTKVKKVEAVKKTVKSEKEKEVKKVAAAPAKSAVVKAKTSAVPKPAVKEAPKVVVKETPKIVEKVKKPEPVKVVEKVKLPERPRVPEKPVVPEKPKAKPTKLRYTREELNDFKRIILEKQSEAINNLQTLRDQMLDPSTGEYINENSPYSLHMAEQGTDAMEKEKNYFYAQREQKFLGYLEEALKRIEAGTYGLCKDCADDPKMLCPTCPLIPKERLEAVPHSQQCVQLKKLQEKPRLR